MFAHILVNFLQGSNQERRAHCPYDTKSHLFQIGNLKSSVPSGKSLVLCQKSLYVAERALY